MPVVSAVTVLAALTALTALSALTALPFAVIVATWNALADVGHRSTLGHRSPWVKNFAVDWS